MQPHAHVSGHAFDEAQGRPVADDQIVHGADAAYRSHAAEAGIDQLVVMSETLNQASM